MSRTLYVTPDSPHARTVRVLLIEKNLPFEQVEVDLRAPSEAFLARSPLGQVPVLADGATHVFEARLIAEYLEDAYPSPPMLGEGWAERLAHRSFDALAHTLITQADLLAANASPGRERAGDLLTRALDALEERARGRAAPRVFGLGHAAVTCAFDHVALRLGRARTARAEATHRWLVGFAARESLAATLPTD